MKLEELKALASQIVETSHAAGMDEDSTKMEMFAQKIPFSKLNSLYKEAAIALGIMVDPKEVTDGVNALVAKIDWEGCEEWSQVEDYQAKIVDNVDGATEARVLTLIRAHCRDEEIDLPAKPKKTSGGGGSRAGKIPAALVDLVNANPDATKQNAYDAVYPLVGGAQKDKNAQYYVNSLFGVIVAAAKQITVVAAGDLLKGQEVQGTPDEVEAEAGDFEEE